MIYKQVLIPILLLSVLIFLVVLNKDEGSMGGMARAVDAATIVVDGKRVQLVGLKPLPRTQECPGATEQSSWLCGREAFIALSKLIDRGRIECDAVGEPVGGVVGGVCRIEQGDLAMALVSAGWGVADKDASPELRAAEKSAREGRKGMWR